MLKKMVLGSSFCWQRAYAASMESWVLCTAQNELTGVVHAYASTQEMNAGDSEIQFFLNCLRF